MCWEEKAACCILHQLRFAVTADWLVKMYCRHQTTEVAASLAVSQGVSRWWRHRHLKSSAETQSLWCPKNLEPTVASTHSTHKASGQQ